MAYVAFSELNRILDQKLAKPEQFQGKLFNFLKLVQHATTYWANGFEQKKLATPWAGPLWKLKLYYRLRAMREKRFGQAPPLTSVLLLENGRSNTDAQGKTGSAYYHHIGKCLDASVQTRILMNAKSELRETVHFVLADLQQQVPHLKPSERGMALLEDAHRVLRSLRSIEGMDAEFMRYAASAFHVFFEQFLMWDALLHDKGVELCVMDNHYHREGVLAAMRMHKVKTVELQHGLVAKNDLYYAYPAHVKAVRKTALFPDAMFLYGQFWKDILLGGYERSAADLHVVGDYTYLGAAHLPPTTNKANTILITAQKNMADFYIPYAQKLQRLLLEKHANWRLQMKLHPLEKEVERYQELQGVKILGNDANLLQLLAESRIHISIYSTTFFDAVGLDTLNLSLQNYSPSADYAREMVESGVALPLTENQDPVALLADTDLSQTGFGNRTHYYAPFDPEKVTELLHQLIRPSSAE